MTHKRVASHNYFKRQKINSMHQK